MGILKGALTVQRFKVAGELHVGWRELYRSRLKEFAFADPPNEQGKEEVEGWVEVHNLLDASFDDFNRWLYGDYLVFALRVDKKRLPARLFRATLEKEIEKWCREREVERCPAHVRLELKERLEQDWLRRTLPTVSVTEAVWSVDGRWLALHALSETVADRFRKRFFRTFGHRLVAWSPLDWLADAHAVEALLSRGPTLVRPGDAADSRGDR